MFHKAGNNKNKLQQRVSKSILKINYESCFCLDAKETFILIQKGPTRRKKNIENTQNPDILQAILHCIQDFRNSDILEYSEILKFPLKIKDVKVRSWMSHRVIRF